MIQSVIPDPKNDHNFIVQSRTIKDNKKKKSNRSLFFSIRIDAYQLGEDPDKISLNFNEPFSRKLLFKKI